MGKRGQKKTGKNPTGQGPKPSGWAIALILAVSISAFLNTLSFEFVFDDTTLIVQNPVVTELQWGQMLGRAGYRPVRTLTYALNYLLGGLNPAGYHLFNVLVHAVNGTLLYLLFSRLSLSHGAALAGALFFAVHPAQTAAVAYVSGRKDLLAALFILLACWFYLEHRRKRSRTSLAGVIGCFVLGVLSKEVAIVLPVLLLLIEFHLRAHRQRLRGGESYKLSAALGDSFKRLPVVFAGLFGLMALGVFYATVITQASRMEGFWGGSIVANLGTGAKLFSHYARLALAPYPLIADYTGAVFPVSKGFLEPSTLFSFLLLIVFVGIGAWASRRNSLFTLGMFWFLACLLPVLQIVPFHELAADHFLYLPMVGAALLAGGFFDAATQNRSSPAIAYMCSALVLAAFMAMTLHRNLAWKDEETLWRTTYRQAPNSYRANLNLGFFVWRRGEWNEAIRLTKRAGELKPAEPLPPSNLGVFYREQAHREIQAGRLDHAEELLKTSMEQLQKAIELDDRDAVHLSNLGDAYKDLAMVWEKRGDSAQAFSTRVLAVQQYKNALASSPGSLVQPFLWYKIGRVLADHRLYDQAVYHFQKVVDELREYDYVQYWTAYSYFELGKYEESVRYFERTLLLSEEVETFSYLAASYERLGQADKAIQTYQRGLLKYPQIVEFHHNLGVLQYRQGQLAEARKHLSLSLQLDPNGPLARRIREMLKRIETES